MVGFTQLFVVFILPNQDFHAYQKSCDYLHELKVKKANEPKFVSFAHAVANPRAVVVMGGHAVVALLAVFAAQRLFNVADGAVFVFDEEYHVFIFFIIIVIFKFNGVIDSYLFVNFRCVIISLVTKFI